MVCAFSAMKRSSTSSVAGSGSNWNLWQKRRYMFWTDLYVLDVELAMPCRTSWLASASSCWRASLVSLSQAASTVGGELLSGSYWHP